MVSSFFCTVVAFGQQSALHNDSDVQGLSAPPWSGGQNSGKGLARSVPHDATDLCLASFHSLSTLHHVWGDHSPAMYLTRRACIVGLPAWQRLHHAQSKFLQSCMSGRGGCRFVSDVLQFAHHWRFHGDKGRFACSARCPHIFLDR